MDQVSRIISGANDRSIKIWDPNTGVATMSLTSHYGGITAVTYNRFANLIASSSYDGTIKLWHGSDGELLNTLCGHELAVNTISFSADGAQLASGSNDETVCIWCTSTGVCSRRIVADERIVSISSNGDGSRVAGASVHQLIIWSSSDGLILLSIPNFASCVAFSNCGNFLVFGTDNYNIVLLDAETGAELQRFAYHSNRICSISFNHDDTLLVTGSSDKTIKVWDATRRGQQTSSPLHTLRGHMDSVYSVAFNTQDNRIASGCDDGTVKVWDNDCCVLTLLGHTSKVNCVSWCAESFDYLLK